MMMDGFSRAALTAMFCSLAIGCSGGVTEVGGDEDMGAANNTTTNSNTNNTSPNNTSTNNTSTNNTSVNNTSTNNTSTNNTSANNTSANNSTQPMLPCDDKFSFRTDTFDIAQPIDIIFEDSVGHLYTNVVPVNPPGEFTYLLHTVTNTTPDPPYQWVTRVKLERGGEWTFEFRSNISSGTPQSHGSCTIMVLEGGQQPGTDPTNNSTVNNSTVNNSTVNNSTTNNSTVNNSTTNNSTMNNSTTPGECLCGEGPGCELCAMEGTCFDSPSMYHPGGAGQSGWECNDVAACTSGGSCRLWCPFEPCPKPGGQGCVNNTEACWVPAGVSNYEDACRICCESYGAIWNSDGNYCQEPL